MVERLRLRVLHFDREPAHSLAARLATRHETSIPRFLRAINLDLRQLAYGRDLNRLAKLSSCAADMIQLNTARPTGIGQSVKLLDENLSWLDWSINPRRVCPACLFYDRSNAIGDGVAWAGWHRVWWDVKCIQICPIHHCPLISRCYKCSEHLNWSTSAIDHCARGHLLASATSEKRFDAKADRYLFERITLSKNSVENRFLDRLTVGNAARVIERLGAIGLQGWLGSVPSLAEGNLLAHRRSVGFSMSLDIENRLHSALDRVIAQRPRQKHGLVASYGWIYRSWLGVIDADQGGEQLRSILFSHAANNGIITAQERCASNRTVSLKAASATFGNSHALTRRILFSAGLVPNGSRPGVAYQIDSREIDRIQSHIATLVDCKTAAKLLGIGLGQFRSLERHGLITVDEQANLLGCGRLFAPTDLLHFAKKLGNGVPVVTQASQQTLGLPSACRDAGVTIATVCRAILDGSIVPVSQNSAESGISAIKVMPKELHALRKPRSRSVSTIAEALEIHVQAASELIKSGAFGDPPDLSDASITLFKRRFAKPNELAALLGCSGRLVIRKLTDAHLRPTFGPPNCRQLFYPRRSATNMLTISTSNNLH